MIAYPSEIKIEDDTGDIIATLTHIVDFSYRVVLEEFITPDQIRFVADVLESKLCNMDMEEKEIK